MVQGSQRREGLLPGELKIDLQA